MVEISKVIDDSYGGKAYGLSILYRNGLDIPQTYCISPDEIVDKLDEARFYEATIKFEENGCYNVAVRSSSLTEDLADESKAGHYLTRIGKFSLGEMIDAIKEVSESGEKMGVIIQQAIDADYSGVVFSSNPITYSKKTGILSYVRGMGEKLVGGDCGHDVEIKFDGYDGQFSKVVNDIKALECKLGYPIDVEWCMKDGKIWYLQCRPITSITSIKGGYYRVDERINQLPSQLISHDKITLRIEAEKAHTFISDAYIYIKNDVGNREEREDIKQSPYGSGYSVVITYPQRVEGKVIRSFVGRKSEAIKTGESFKIHSYPKYNGLEECISAFNDMLNDYWISVAIIQEIFDAKYTGIVQKLGAGYLIEITKGHFLTKGVALTSQYYVENEEIKEKNEINQYCWYAIVQGHIIQCKSNEEDNSLVFLDNREILEIIRSFKDIIKDGSRVVEFGIVSGEGGQIPYLIDFVDAENGNTINPDYIKEGIISRGKRSGRLVRITQDEDTLNKHFHDRTKSERQVAEDIIFLCKSPSIALLELLYKYDNTRIAFAFEDGSILCHLAVVLRERSVPAAKVGDIDKISNGWYILDAETTGIARERRLIKSEFGSNI